MSAPTVRLATATDHDSVVATVCTAFADDPAFNYFFPTPEAWAADAPIFVGALLGARLSTTWVIGEESSAAALAMWSPPSAGAMRESLDALSSDSLARLREYNAATKDGLPTEPFWYLGILATHPDQAGKRLGRAAMDPGLRQAGQSGIPAYLETTNSSNVELYERSGWETTSATDYADFTITVLRHTGL